MRVRIPRNEAVLMMSKSSMGPREKFSDTELGRETKRLAMKIKPVHIWYVGVMVFGLSVLLWTCSIVLIAIKFKPDLRTDSYAVTDLYLPLLAAFLGICWPLASLRRLRNASRRKNLICFGVYVVVMLAWGVTDVKHERYQVGGHDYPNNPLVDGHRYYWHIYFTWYFLPYRSIHNYDFAQTSF
jgi:hypothetical protein